jgi:hypothetical protein
MVTPTKTGKFRLPPARIAPVGLPDEDWCRELVQMPGASGEQAHTGVQRGRISRRAIQVALDEGDGARRCRHDRGDRDNLQQPSGGERMPMFKLSKADSQKIMAAIKRTEEPAAALMAAVATYNEALGPLRELIRTIEADWQAVWDARSERWQEGTVGQSVAEIITAWDALADDLEDVQVELPEIIIPVPLGSGSIALG